MTGVEYSDNCSRKGKKESYVLSSHAKVWTVGYCSMPTETKVQLKASPVVICITQPMLHTQSPPTLSLVVDGCK